MRSSWLCTFALLGSLAACSDEAYIVITVASRPAVHDAAKLRVTLSNAGTMRTDELPLGREAFPVTFSVSAPGRTGALDVAVEAVDASNLLVGRGTTSTSIAATSADVMLETADFVVNTDFAEDQFPSDDFEAHGFQVASATDGMWTVAYRGRCAAPCTMLGRRFDAGARPVSTRVAAGTNGFPLGTALTTAWSTPAIATSGNTTLAVWDFEDPTAQTLGIACRSFDAMGQAIPNELVLATDPTTDVVTATALSNNNFAVAWKAFIGTSVIRSAIVRPDCTVLTGPVTTSTTAGSARVAIAASGAPSTVLYAWIANGTVRVRFADNTNAFTAAGDAEFLPATTTEVVEFVRVAPLATGFAVVVRWITRGSTTGPGRLELYRTNISGGVIGGPVMISNRSGSDFGSSEGFGVATGPSGTLMVVWHACLDNGDGNGCGVFGRAFRPDGTPIGPEIVIATTTNGDQTNPSVTALPDDSFAVVWKDESAAEPDISGSSVRARVIYPLAN